MAGRGKGQMGWDDDMQGDSMEMDMPSYDVPPVQYFGEIFRGGVWLRVTGACKTEQEAKKELKKWRSENPREVVTEDI